MNDEIGITLRDVFFQVYTSHREGYEWDVCPVVVPEYFIDTLEKCRNNCDNNAECTAYVLVEFSGGGFCIEYQCDIPAPEPTMERPGNVKAYSKILGKICSIIFSFINSLRG